MGTNWWALLGSGVHDAARRKEKKTHVNICRDCGKQYAKTIKWPQTCPRCGSNSKDSVSKEMIVYEANKKKEEKRKTREKKPRVCFSLLSSSSSLPSFLSRCSSSHLFPIFFFSSLSSRFLEPFIMMDEELFRHFS